MRKILFFFSVCLLTWIQTLPSFANCGGCDCGPSFEVGIGWRRDNLNWKVSDMEGGCYNSAEVKSHIKFDDIDMYAANGKLRWLGDTYYVRFSAMYALSEKGRAKQDFFIEDPYLLYCEGIGVSTNNHIKRRSEFYDFDLAVGYPLTFCSCKLVIIPTIGYSYDRQRINVKEEHHSSSSCCCDCQNNFRRDRGRRDRNRFARDRNRFARDRNRFARDRDRNRDHCSSSDSSSFSVSSSNPFYPSVSSNPFSSSSCSENIASALGLSNHRESANYRFSWYGPFAGLDITYTLDCCWTLFAEFEGHFLSNVHRKRKSWTGVRFVDSYHHKGDAYGFDGAIGTSFIVCDNWYTTLAVDAKWWRGDSKHDKLDWDSISANIAIGYDF